MFDAIKGGNMDGMKISGSPQVQTPSKVQKPPEKEEKPSSPKINVKDTVQISSAAQQALQEATETAAQTKQEAAKGDQQAVRLLARQEAAKSTVNQAHISGQAQGIES
jgi:hypothetical protein